MKKIIKKVLEKAHAHHQRIHYRELFYGVIIGFVIGIVGFSLLVPSGMDMIKLYNSERFKSEDEWYKRENMRLRLESSTTTPSVEINFGSN